jgi:hypothetical protein
MFQSEHLFSFYPDPVTTCSVIDAGRKKGINKYKENDKTVITSV